MGDTVGVLSEIEKVSEIKPHVLDAKGILVATFSSVSTPKELNEWFRLNQRSFLIFDLNPQVSGYNITKSEIHEGLFGFLRTLNLEDKSAELLREINLTSDTSTTRSQSKLPTASKFVKKITEKDVAKMTRNEKDALCNKIIDNGVENLSEEDKNLLQILSK